MKKVVFALTGALLMECVIWIVQWVHSVFVIGLNPFLGAITVMIFLALVGVGVVLGILWRKKLLARFGLAEVGAMELFLAGCFFGFLEGMLKGNSTLDIQIHDTYFVIAHGHFWFAFALLFGLMAIVYAGFPLLTGRSLNRTLGIIHFWGSIPAAFLLWPRFGWDTMPRRYLDYSSWISFNERASWNPALIWCLIIALAAQLLFVFNLGYSTVRGKKIR